MGSSWIPTKEGILKKRDVDLEKGGYDPLTDYVLGVC